MTFIFAPDKPQIAGIRIDRGVAQQQPVGAPQRSAALAECGTWSIRGRRSGEFSGTVLIARGENVLWQGAYGFANRDAHIPNQADTRFDVGSIAKSFTRVAMAQLVEQGKLKFTAKSAPIF